MAAEQAARTLRKELRSAEDGDESKSSTMSHMLKKVDRNMFNAATSLFSISIVVLNWDQIHIVQSLAVIIFSIIAATAHVFPTALKRSTHIVKAAFTFAAMSDAEPGLQLAVFAVTLLPFISSGLAKLEALGGVTRQLWMAKFLYIAFISGQLSAPEAAAMVVCKVVYHFERKQRCDAGKRDEYGMLHSFEHVDLYLFVLVALVPMGADRYAHLSNLFYLMLSASCVAAVPIRHGDGCRACLGALMIIFSDWYSSQTYYLALSVTLIYVKSRGSNPHLWFKWSRWQGLYALSLVVSAKIFHEKFGRLGLAASACFELLLLLLGVHQRRPDIWAALWSCVVLTSLYPWPSKLALGIVWTLADIMDLRFMERLKCGIHLSLLGLYFCRDLSVMPIYVFWLVCGVGFLGINLYLGVTSKPPSWMPKDLLPWFNKKLFGNAYAANPVGYMLKPSSPILSWEFMTWTRIINMIDTVDFQGFDADLVVGVLSGGAFIQPIVSRRHTKADRAVIRSQVWSMLTAKENIQSVGHVFWNKSSWRESKCKELRWTVEPDSKKEYSKVLIVDDSVSSGKTIANVLRFVRKRYPSADVRIFVLYAPEASSGVCHLDYVVSSGRVPLLWPWGVEMD